MKCSLSRFISAMAEFHLCLIHPQKISFKVSEMINVLLWQMSDEPLFVLVRAWKAFTDASLA